MEITEQNQKDVEAYLNKHKNGATSSDLELHCPSMENKLHLCRTLHFMVKRGTIRRQDSTYFIVDEKDRPKDTTETVGVYGLRDKPVAPLFTSRIHYWTQLEQKRRNKLANQEKEKATDLTNIIPVRGFLGKETSIGTIALALCVFKDLNPLTMNELVELTGLKKQTCYTLTGLLIDKKYVVRKAKIGRENTYQWSGFFSYPFATTSSLDAFCLKYTVDEWLDIQRLKNNKNHKRLAKMQFKSIPVSSSKSQARHCA